MFEILNEQKTSRTIKSLLAFSMFSNVPIDILIVKLPCGLCLVSPSVHGPPALQQDTRSSSYPDPRSHPSIPILHHLPRGGPRCGPRSHDPAVLQGLLVISKPAPLFRRPGFSHMGRSSSRRAPPTQKQQDKGQWAADAEEIWRWRGLKLWT